MDKIGLVNVNIDYNEGLKRFSGVEALYDKYLERFITDETFNKLQKQMNEKNIEEAFKAAHMLKGVMGNLSMNSLMNILNPFIEALRANDLELAEEQFPNLVRAYNNTVACLKEAFDN